MDPVLPVVLGVVGTIISGVVVFVNTKRQYSGKIGTTEAETLWAESQSMRKELRDESDNCRAEVAALRTEMVGVRAEGVAMREELVALRQEGIVLRAESVALREEMVTLREESVLLRKADLQGRLNDRIREGLEHDDEAQP